MTEPSPVDVLGLLAQGHDMAAVAGRLGLTVRAARLLLKQAMTEYGARSDTHAVALAIAQGDLPADIAHKDH